MDDLTTLLFKSIGFTAQSLSGIALLLTSASLANIGNAAEVLVSFTHIKVLAASCAACHGSNGQSVAASQDGANAVLAGMAASEFTDKMLGFRDGSRKATVMHHHAKGLTVDEIKQLGDYFANQKLGTLAPIKSQSLKAP